MTNPLAAGTMMLSRPAEIATMPPPSETWTERETTTPRPDTARKAFDDLFNF